MKWCLACGSVQWGVSSCEACGDTYRAGALGFSDLYKSYARQLRRFVRRVTADRGLPESLVDAEGVVHDTFVVLLSGSGPPIRNPAAWLFTVARNQVSKAAAAQRRIAACDPADHWDDGGAVWLSMMTAAPDAEDVRAAREVMRAIAGLPDHQRVATYLRQVQGWSLAEIGAYLGCAASTAGVHISRGTTKVRSSLSEDPGRRDVGNANRTAAGRGRSPLRSANLSVVVSLLVSVASVALAIASNTATDAAGARTFYLPSWLLYVTAAVVAAVISMAVVRWWRREEIGQRLRAEAEARHRQRRFNRWLRTGRALDPPGRHRRP